MSVRVQYVDPQRKVKYRNLVTRSEGYFFFLFISKTDFSLSEYWDTTAAAAAKATATATATATAAQYTKSDKRLEHSTNILIEIRGQLARLLLSNK